MPWYYRADGRWIEVPYGREDVQEFSEWASDGKYIYRILTCERYQQLRTWLEGRDGKEASRLRELIAEYEAHRTETQSQTAGESQQAKQQTAQESGRV